MKQLSQNISSTCRGDNVDIKYTTTTTTIFLSILISDTCTVIQYFVLCLYTDILAVVSERCVSFNPAVLDDGPGFGTRSLYSFCFMKLFQICVNISFN